MTAGAMSCAPTRRWAWRTIASPWADGPRRVPHLPADRVGQPVHKARRGNNGNARFDFPHGFWTIAPWRAAG